MTIEEARKIKKEYGLNWCDIHKFKKMKDADNSFTLKELKIHVKKFDKLVEGGMIQHIGYTKEHQQPVEKTYKIP